MKFNVCLGLAVSLTLIPAAGAQPPARVDVQDTVRRGLEWLARRAHDECHNYYLAQAVYVLGDDRYGKLFPGTPASEHLTWSRFRETMYGYLKSTQSADGSWSGGYVGPIFGTTTALTILQLENNTLPIYMH